MVVKDFIHHAAVAYAYTRTAYLILYLDAFEIFSVTGLLSMYLLFENVRMNLLRSKKKNANVAADIDISKADSKKEDIDQVQDDLARNIFESCLLHSVVSVGTLLYAFTRSPLQNSVELARINSLLCLNEDFDLLKSMDFGMNDMVSEVKIFSLHYIRLLRQKFKPNLK